MFRETIVQLEFPNEESAASFHAQQHGIIEPNGEKMPFEFRYSSGRFVDILWPEGCAVIPTAMLVRSYGALRARTLSP